MYAVTLPGFGDTPPLPMPTDGSQFGDTPWTRSTIQAIEALLDQEHLARVTIVAHWALATQIALRLALDHPERVEAVVIVGGPLKVYYEGSPGMLTWTAAQRTQFVEGMGQRWFKTVTRRTWDDNNFMPYDYAINPRRGLFLWREAQAPSLPDRDYMRNLCLDSWRGAAEASDRLEFVTIPQSRLFIMYDQPEELHRVVERFLRRKTGQAGPTRQWCEARNKPAPSDHHYSVGRLSRPPKE